MFKYTRGSLRRLQFRSFSSAASSPSARNRNRTTLYFVLSTATVIGVAKYHTSKSVVHNDSALTPPEVNLRTPGGKQSSLLSEGWGSNKTKLLRPQDSVDVIKTPSALPLLDDIALRDLVLHEKHAACVDARGDVYQWGDGLCNSGISQQPVLTLRGKNIKQLAASGSRIVALSHSGQVYVLSTTTIQPVPPDSSVWVPWASSNPGASVELIPQTKLSRGEKFAFISAGEDHLLALTSTGRTFTHPFTKNANTYGQLGLRRFEVPSDNGSSTRLIDLVPNAVSDPYASSSPRARKSSTAELDSNSTDASDLTFCRNLFEIPALKGIEVSQIATGGHSSFVRTSTGRVLGWGANQYGQIGLGDNITLNTITVPTEVVFWRNVPRATSSKCLDICAGGDLALFTIERRDGTAIDTIDVLACGNGQWGSLGNGLYTTSQSNPVRVKGVSGLLEYSEHTNNMQPILPHAISISPTGHVLLTLDTWTRSTGIHSGRDLIVFGANHDGQLGTGKRSSLASATTLHRPDGSRYMLAKANVDAVNDLRGRVWKRNVNVEQTAVAGYGNSIVYWRII